MLTTVNRIVTADQKETTVCRHKRNRLQRAKSQITRVSLYLQNIFLILWRCRFARLPPSPSLSLPALFCGHPSPHPLPPTPSTPPENPSTTITPPQGPAYLPSSQQGSDIISFQVLQAPSPRSPSMKEEKGGKKRPRKTNQRISQSALSRMYR